MWKQLIKNFLLIAYSIFLIDIMVFRNIPIIRIGHMIFRFGGADANGRANFIPFKTIMMYLHGTNGWLIASANVLGNIALLVPFGFLLPCVWSKITWRKCLVIALTTGFVIEGLQVLLHLGIFDIDDVILNGLGVMVGYWIYALASSRVFIAEKVIPSSILWNKVKERILFLEQDAFGEKAFPEEDMATDFSDERNTIVLLKENKSGKIIGFTYAKPDANTTAFMWDTVIDKEFQGRHLVGVMMRSLEKELKRKGYTHIEREVAVANNYAQNIAKAYARRIEKQGQPHDSMWGQQVFFRIKL